jgi:ABC-type sugar transport system ATPase subunit
VYVTHDQEEAMTLGTRVAVMQGGSLEQVAAPMELYTAPANRFVGEFVGSPAMNLIASHRLITAAPAMAGRIPDPAIVGVRPHDIELTAAGEGDASGRVAVVEMLGSAVLLHVAVTGIDDELVRVLVGDLAPVTVDTPVGLRFRSDRLHMFDPAGGARFS